MTLWPPSPAPAQQQGTPYQERVGDYTLIYSAVFRETFLQRPAEPVAPRADADR